MSEHSSCPNCHNTDGATNIYKCDKCHRVFCSRCSKFGWLDTKCPRCESAGSCIGFIVNEQEEANRREREREERDHERSQREEHHQEEMLRALEAQREDEDLRQQEMLEALEAETEARRTDIANAWQLQSESKAESASELYEAGMYEQALRLALESIGEIGRGDPTNMKGHMIAAWSLEKLGRATEAHKYYSTQISLLRTSSYLHRPGVFLRVLKSLPADNVLLSSFSNNLQGAALQWDSFNDYSGTAIDFRSNASDLIDVLMSRQLSVSAQNLAAIIERKAECPSSYYYPVLNTCLKHRLFHETQLLTAKLMERCNSLELQAYWLEVSARGGGPVNDRLNAFLNDIHYDKASEFVNAFNALTKAGSFSNNTTAWIRDRISERYDCWAAEKTAAENERSRHLAPATQQWTPPEQQHERVWPWVLGGVALLFIGALALMILVFASLPKQDKNSGLTTRTVPDSNLPQTGTSVASGQPVGVAGNSLFSSQGGWRAINMTNGLRGASAAGGGFYYGYFEYINFADSFRGRTLNVEVKSQYLPTTIELWRDNIPGNDHAWWSHYEQVATSSDNFEQKPQLQWTITPGNYTLFFSAYTGSGRVTNMPFYAKLDVGPAPVEENTDTAESSAKEETAVEDTGGQSSNQTVAPPVSGGVLNGKAISLPQPAYPALAKQQRVSGQVTVEVTIDETGVVISARAVSGPMLLRSAAIAAARQARFTPTMLSGKPVKVEGTINYNFVLE